MMLIRTTQIRTDYTISLWLVGEYTYEIQSRVCGAIVDSSELCDTSFGDAVEMFDRVVSEENKYGYVSI